MASVPGSPIYELQPLTDARWRGFIERHPHSSVFQAQAWLEALRRTYGYEPVALTTSPPGAELSDAIVLCRVESVLTGRRLVSLPFSDHCEPLVGSPQALSALVFSLREKMRSERIAYIECRPLTPIHEASGLIHSQYEYALHQLNLTPDLPTLFKAFHKDSTQRKIRRAEREGLVYEEGASSALLETFCQLNLLTRLRHGIPPQPNQWFENLIACFGSALKIRVALKDRRPIAAILTIRHKDTLVYKYGSSDAAFNNLGGTHMLFWKSIQEAKCEGLKVFDLGRSNMESTGLKTFKSRWGAKQSTLCYSRFTTSIASRDNYRAEGPDWESQAAKHVLAYLPKSLWRFLGNRLYKHIG